MTIKIITGDSSIEFSNKLVAQLWKDFSNLVVETYDEDNYKDKKKAIMIKASCGTRLIPFVAIYNDKKDLLKAFYSEVKECTSDNIIKYLNTIL